MKLTKFFANIGVFFIFSAIFTIVTLQSNNSIANTAILVSLVILAIISGVKLEKSFNKQLEEIKKAERRKGANMYVGSFSETERFKAINNLYPFFDEKGKKVGERTVYSDMRQHLVTMNFD